MEFKDSIIKSLEIKTFPSIGRDESTDLNAELTNEKNLTQLLKSIYKRESFVISDSLSNDENKFIFVLHGYYFEINSTTSSDLIKIINKLKAENKASIYAHIVIYDNNVQRLVNADNTKQTELLKLDIDNFFHGVVITGDPVYTNDKYEVKTLKILELDTKTNKFVVPSESKLHWKSSEILNEDNTSLNEKFKTDKIECTEVTGDLRGTADKSKAWDTGKNISITSDDLSYSSPATTDGNYSINNLNLNNNAIKEKHLGVTGKISTLSVEGEVLKINSSILFTNK